ncbi:MAG: hypothetical protein DIJKHBIC_03071 [Thermoanaerobaculia bacterium]|nr:hypothetical protein [Thermoanaerobaculia bacterium]
MYLTALTQRERLFALVIRWLQGRLEPSDGRFLTLSFLVDPVITSHVLTNFLRDIAAPEDGSLRLERLRTKHDVRQRIADAWPDLTPRATELLSEFRKRPEHFYPTTPVDLVAVTASEHDLKAMVRFKNITRIADKVSRRATARFDQEIRRRAEALKGEGSRGHDDAEGELFVEAERLVCLDIASGSLPVRPPDFLVHDLVGVKLIGDPSGLERFESRVAVHPQVISVQRTEHRGVYRDTHLVVELACPPLAASVDWLRAQNWDQAARRGLTAATLRRWIPEYVESAERSFFVEILLTTREDLVESEFGRGLHEERTERQREGLMWARQLPTNVALIIMYALLVAVGPKTEVQDLPVKLAGRYLPDTIAVLLGRLFDLDIDRSPLSVPSAGGGTDRV